MHPFNAQLPALALLATCFVAASCGQPTASAVSEGSIDQAVSTSTSESSGSTATPAGPKNRFAPGGEITDAQLAEYYVSMTCEIDGESVGTLTFDMWTEGAPITTRNFLRLADEGFYNGLTFHRILREFMIQGGDPQGTGLGGSLHGNILAEFSEEPERRHGYGVLSMARGGHDVNSASSQFFLCCDESPSVWGLDGKYSSFGRLTSGVAALEKLADVPVTSNSRGEVSTPTRKAKITEAKVIKGEAPTGETIARPEEAVELNGEPRRVRIQQILIGFKDLAPQGIKSTLTEDQAKELAAKLKLQLEGGAEMTPLVRQHTDLPFQETDEVPGDYRVLNNGIRDRASERLMHDLVAKFKKRGDELGQKLRSGELKPDAYQAAGQALQSEFNAAQVALGESLTVPRANLDPALREVAFGMKVGEVIILDHDLKKSSVGYRVVKRLE
jgi:peptidylprolyl isomerase/peptidyl-prolyl cis-trans isomerase B (cyclophilin B)